MKKFGNLILLILITAISIISLSSCGGSDTPSGMQLVYGGETAGYCFYAPEEWTVSNTGEIKSAYVSRVDTTSVSFAEVLPEKFLPITEIKAEDYFFNSYFNDSLSEFPASSKITVTVNGENTVFGKVGEEADRAVKYAYNYEYAEHKFGFMQILIKEGDRYFIFTYCALLEEKKDGKTYYDYYLEDKVLPIIENFRFTEKTGDNAEKVYKKDKDGFILISEAKLAGFNLYVPETFVPDYSSAIVSATHSDGSNINMSEATMTGNNVTVADYWNFRKQELAAIVTNLTEIKINEPVKLGNADAAFSYEYTFVYNGETYHVYQIYAIEGPLLLQEGYVFTYTAKNENFGLHFEDVKSVVGKVDFK